jgi:hypothetical protein
VAGTQLFGSSDAYGSYVPPVGGNLPAQGSHLTFILWVLILGVILPGVILGGLKAGGFSFVFRGR